MTDERHSLDAIEAALAQMPSARFKARLRTTLEQRIRQYQEDSSMTTSVTDTVLSSRGARPGFTAVTAYVQVQEIEQLIAFAKDVFGAEETMRGYGSAGGIHCELRIGDSMLMAGGGAGPDAQGQPLPPRIAALHVYVDDADAIYQRALAAGATSLGPPADAHYGERAGYVTDPTGNEWYIATHTGPSYSSEGLRTVTPSMRVPAASDYIAFLEAALGARVEANYQEEGVVRHAVLRIEDAAIELGEAHAPWGSVRSGFYLYVPDCDALYQRAMAAGAKSLSAPADMPYGDRMGGIEDMHGNQWYIATHLGQKQA
jgi:PhnB protein